MKKYVITGGPCCGKTSVIEELKKRGFYTISETARDILTKKAWIKNGESLQVIIFNKQLEKESELENRCLDIVFLDRGLIDSVAYFLIYQRTIPEEILKYPQYFFKRYEAVFVLERLPFVSDGIRVENSDEEAKKIHEKIVETYNFYGYSPVFIPLMKVEERVNFILNYLNLKKD